MKIKYKGKEYTEVFGLAFKPGETLEVEDAFAIEKLRFHPMFEAADGKDKPKDGDKPKAVTPTEELKRLTEQQMLERMADTNKAILTDIERKKREG